MKPKSKKILSFLLLLTMLLGAFQPIVSMASGTDGKSEDSKKTTRLVIHKLKYDTALDTSKKITNDGTEKTYDASIKPYNATEYGEVGFTLYKLNRDKVADMIKTKGNAQSVADEIASNIEDNTVNGTGIIEVRVSEFKQEEGAGPMQKLVKTTTDGEYFLLVETTSPATIADKAQPMLLQLPMRSADGKSLLDTVHLYPKNKVDESKRELEFNKVVLKVAQDGTVDATTKFEGADFEVYKGKPGSGEKLMEEGNSVKLTSNAQGTFKITGLTVGNYYLVEIGNDKVDSLDKADTKSKANNFIASVDARNDINNKYAFRMDEDGYIYKITGWDEDDTATTSKGTKYNAENEKLPSIKNTIKPSTSKKLTTKAGSIGYNDVLGYEIDVNIPANFGKNSNDEKLVINDKITEGAIINTDSFKVYDKEGKERINIKPTVERVSDNEVNITVDKNTIKTDGDNVSYKPIVIKYTVKLSKDFAVNGDAEIKNNITSKYTVDGNEFDEPENPVNPGNPDKPTPDKNKEVTVKTYTKKLKKVDSGLFETGAVKNPVADAEFILGRKIGDDVEYRKEDATDKYVWTKTKSEAQVVRSGKDGTFQFEGLAAKTDEGTEITYFAEEVKAPANYVLPVNEVDRKHEFTFTGENVELEIKNNKAVDAPMTGYEKSTLVILGLGMLLATAAVIERKKKTA